MFCGTKLVRNFAAAHDSLPADSNAAVFVIRSRQLRVPFRRVPLAVLIEHQAVKTLLFASEPLSLFWRLHRTVEVVRGLPVLAGDAFDKPNQFVRVS